MRKKFKKIYVFLLSFIEVLRKNVVEFSICGDVFIDVVFSVLKLVVV